VPFLRLLLGSGQYYLLHSGPSQIISP